MRTLVLGFLLLAAVAAPPALAGATDAAVPKSIQLRLLAIVCHEANDNNDRSPCSWLTRDEPYLAADGGRVWGPVDMQDGDERSLRTVPGQPFRRSIDLALFDADQPDPDDHLGTVRIGRDALGAGVQTATFTGGGAHYTVTYEVVRVVSEVVRG